MLISSQMTGGKRVSPGNPRDAAASLGLGLTSGLGVLIFVLDNPVDYTDYSIALLCLAFHLLTETSS